jgi:deoxyuridine 5'-triphosphate nucleotidohydrolase
MNENVLKSNLRKRAALVGYKNLTEDERAFLDGHITYREYLYGPEEKIEDVGKAFESLLEGIDEILDAVTPKMFNTVFNDGSNLQRNNADDAGADVKAAEQVIIGAWGKKLVSTGLYVSIPKGFVGLLWSRSGLAAKHDIEVGAGCIDAPYRGEVKVLLRNFSDDAAIIERGVRIAQMIILPVLLTPWADVRSMDDLGETDRGIGGFGSTGL